MAKSGRKKKEKRKDFQKVKFKVGKKKPQADNFTDTTFKSQAIQIREQLKSGRVNAAEPTTLKKKNIHDLLCHLNHYNVSIRQSSIAGMKELLSGHPLLISQHLALLIDSLSALMTDKEDAVRKAGISLLQLVLQATPPDRVGPFFPVLAAHLTSAMTHLQEGIRLDSLAVLDVMLASYPRLLTGRSQELLTVFVRMISRQREKSVGWAGGPDGGELAIKPGSRISSHKWRQKVLLRLGQFLSALLEECHTKHSGPVDSTAASGNRTIKVQEHKKTFAPIFAPGSQAQGYRPEFILSSMSTASSSTTSRGLDEPAQLLEFVRSLVPLLLQCWMEVAPRSRGQCQAQLHNVATEILDGVLSVILLLWRWMQCVCEAKCDFGCMEQLQKLYCKKFVGHLLPGFPYASHDAPARAKHSGKAAAPVTPVSLNLSACEVMSYFMTGADLSTPWLRKVMAYVLETCVAGGSLSSGHVQSLLGVVRRLVDVLPNEESMSDLLQAVFSFYDSCHLLSAHKQATLRCLDELLSTHRGRHPSSRPIDGAFLQSLPELIMTQGTVSSKALQILLRRTSQRQAEALNCTQDHLKSFVDPDNGVLLKLSAELQCCMIQLIHHADTLDLDTLRMLALCCQDNRISAENVAYLVNVLSTRLLDVGISPYVNWDFSFSLADFVSFLFSVSVGSMQFDLTSSDQQDVGRPRPLPNNLTPVSIATQSGRSWQHHCTILKSVCLGYNLISSKQQMWDLLQKLINKLLNSHKTFPRSTLYTILRTANYLVTAETYWRQETLDKLTDCCLATLYQVVSDDVTGGGRSDWSEAIWEEAVDMLVTTRPVLTEMMQRIHAGVADLTDPEYIHHVAMVIVRLLQTQRLTAFLAKTADVMQAVNSIMSHHLATEGNRWVAELQYEATVVLKAQFQR